MQFGRPRLDLDLVAGPPVRQRGGVTRQAQPKGRSKAAQASCQKAARFASDSSLIAFRPLRNDGPFRAPLARGRAGPLDDAERLAAMEVVTRDVYAASMLHVMEANMKTVRKKQACWNLPLVPYIPEVVYALGQPLKGEGTARPTYAFT